MIIDGFYISPGNTKVQWPIINLGSGTDCPSRQWCPFDRDNRKAAGRRLCYAQKIEKLRPTVLACRRKNEAIIRSLDVDGILALSSAIANKLKSAKIVRINESGDLAGWNIDFAMALIRALRGNGTAVYLYSKAPQRLQNMARKAGAVVLHSDRDFVAYKNVDDLRTSGAIPCPGKCGPCALCPSFAGGKIGILEH